MSSAKWSISGWHWYFGKPRFSKPRDCSLLNLVFRDRGVWESFCNAWYCVIVVKPAPTHVITQELQFTVIGAHDGHHTLKYPSSHHSIRIDHTLNYSHASSTTRLSLSAGRLKFTIPRRLLLILYFNLLERRLQCIRDNKSPTPQFIS